MIRVGHFERNPKRRSLDRRRVLDRVYGAHMARRRQFDRRHSGMKDRLAVIAICGESGLLGHTQDIAIEANGLIEVVGLDDQTKLARWLRKSHAPHDAC